MSDLDRTIVRSSAWLALSYGGTQVISLAVTATLAHLLTPSEFGLVTLAGTALLVLGILQESGLAVATIQRRSDVEEAVASTFVVSTALGVALYGGAWVAAPLAADLLRTPQLTEILRVLALLLVLRGPSTATAAVIERELRFGRRAVGELSAIAVQSAVAIVVAVLGGGVWSLVAGQLAGQLVQTTMYWVVAPIRPDVRRASWRMTRELGRFGRHVTAANLVGLVDANADTVTVGRVLGPAAVGSYNLAWRLSNLPATGLAYVVGRAMLPAYASIATDLDAFRAAFLTNIRRVGLLSLPVSLGILLA
ncbi:MAG TPA: oligosaccharide flippase family protein, partial [Gaiellaceae bacterium]|nr:oligosaccharide flippase family protein [Gaiellaceae bacterium]